MKKKELSMKLKIIFCFLFSFCFFHTYGYVAYQDTLYKDSLCDYTWNQDVNDCPDVLDCIYPGLWQDITIEVPANITRITKDGLKLCLEDVEMKAPVDIIYIMDLSGSMKPVLDNNGNIIGGGDPYKKRDDALEAGFNYQVNNFPQSKAGYIGFGTKVEPSHLLAPVNASTGQTQLNSIVNELRTFVNNNQSAGYTDYRKALAQAISWIQDPSICPHKDKAIIFISDGEPKTNSNMVNPYPSTQQENTLIAEEVPVYGIFLGSGMGDALEDLATLTGGASYLVPPANTDTLETVVENIEKILT